MRCIEAAMEKGLSINAALELVWDLLDPQKSDWWYHTQPSSNLSCKMVYFILVVQALFSVFDGRSPWQSVDRRSFFCSDSDLFSAAQACKGITHLNMRNGLVRTPASRRWKVTGMMKRVFYPHRNVLGVAKGTCFGRSWLSYLTCRQSAVHNFMTSVNLVFLYSPPWE